MADRKIVSVTSFHTNQYDAILIAQAADGTWWWTQPSKFAKANAGWQELSGPPGIIEPAQRGLTTEEKIMSVPDVFAEHRDAEARAVSGSMAASK